MTKIVLDIDDGSIMRNRRDLLDNLKEQYPNLKLTLFYILYDYVYERSSARILRETSLKWLQDRLDWIQLVPHGIVHLNGEFHNASYDVMSKYLDSIEEEFAKDGLPCEKGFKAPNWLWNKEVVRALDERGWWGAVDRNQPDMVCPKRFYKYDHSIDEQFWKIPNDGVLKLHGHMTPPSQNDIARCFENLMYMPNDSSFHFVSEFIEELPEEGK